jgi:hypothetical protein
MSQPTSPPLLRVVRGNPTPEELAAVTAVIAARSVATETAKVAVSDWADPSGAHRRSVPVGPGAWAASGRTPGVRTRADW